MPPSADRPGVHPLPPLDFQERALPLLHLPRGSQWSRLHRVAQDPLQFSRTGYHRFDAPAHEYGMLYCGDDEECAFIESFGDAVWGGRSVSLGDLAQRNVVTITLQTDLHVVDFTGSHLAALGADLRLTTGDYRIAQQWALACWSHQQQPDGIHYLSRRDPSKRCIALYDRVHRSLTVDDAFSLADLGHRPLLARILNHYQFGLED